MRGVNFNLLSISVDSVQEMSSCLLELEPSVCVCSIIRPCKVIFSCWNQDKFPRYKNGCSSLCMGACMFYNFHFIMCICNWISSTGSGRLQPLLNLWTSWLQEAIVPLSFVAGSPQAFLHSGAVWKHVHGVSMCAWVLGTTLISPSVLASFWLALPTQGSFYMQIDYSIIVLQSSHTY